MLRLRLSISVLAATAFMTPVFAVDGVTLINQSTVLGAGGFPYQITQPGSYRLSGNLIAASTSAINITASNVTLDLNGFTISCTACSGVSGIQSGGTGTTILNGTVTGFGGPGAVAPYGISFLLGGGKVDHVTATGNMYGFVVRSGADLTVTHSSALNNFVGISGGASSLLTITNSVISGNAQDGIDIANGLITGNTIIGNGLTGTFTRGGIIAAGGGVNITNNLIANNAVFGIALAAGAGTVTAGYGSNTFAGNTVDVSAASTSFISMHNNVCAGGGC